MAATNVIAAAILKYEALTAANFPSASRPEIYLDEAPQYDAVQVRTPYVIIADQGTKILKVFGSHFVELTDFTLTIYYRSKADSDSAANAIKYNGGAITANSGFDNGSLAAYLPASDKHYILTRMGDRDLPPELDYQGQLVHPVELRYTAGVQR